MPSAPPIVAESQPWARQERLPPRERFSPQTTTAAQQSETRTPWEEIRIEGRLRLTSQYRRCRVHSFFRLTCMGYDRESQGSVAPRHVNFPYAPRPKMMLKCNQDCYSALAESCSCWQPTASRYFVMRESCDDGHADTSRTCLEGLFCLVTMAAMSKFSKGNSRRQD